MAELVVDCLDSAARVLELRQSMDSALRDGWFSLSQAKYSQRSLLQAQDLMHVVNCALGSKPCEDDGEFGFRDHEFDDRRTPVEGQAVVAVTLDGNRGDPTFTEADAKKGEAGWMGRPIASAIAVT